MYNDENNVNSDRDFNNEAGNGPQGNYGQNDYGSNDSNQNQNPNGYNQNQSQNQNGYNQNQNGYNQNPNGEYRFNGNYGYQNNTNNQQNNPYGAPYGGNQNPNGNGKWKKVVASLALVAGIVLVGSAGAYGVGKVSEGIMQKAGNETADSNNNGKKENEATPTPQIGSTQDSEGVTDSVASVVENVMPAIVSITTTSKETVSDFFGRPYSEDVQGSGSGIIFGQNPNEVLIATNHHVIAGENARVKVTFNDGKSVDGIVKDSEKSADLAVVAVKFAEISDQTKNKIKVISMGDSNKTKVGEVAIAIGNALGYGQSVTVGHISALDREIAVEDSSMTLMQTDAAINPGNSGGALLNAKGQLIGINSAKTALTEVEGMGYAIPISSAQPILQELMKGNNTTGDNKAYLGIMGNNITKAYSQRFNFPIGVYVTEVVKGSPAEKAGIVKGMVIVGFDGKEIKTTNDITRALSTLSVGDRVTVNVAVNNGGKFETRKLTVTMGSKSDGEDNDTHSSQNDEYRQNPNEGGQRPDQDDDFFNDDPFGFFGD